MFCKVTLVATALALLVAANPIEVAREPKKLPTGIRIPLHKRTAITDKNGVFNHDALIAEVVKLKNKHRQNLINIAQNGGSSDFTDGATINPIATVPNQRKRASKGGAVPLTAEQEESLWTGAITIGSPAQDFTIDFDTGSSDLWVPDSTCDSCGDHNKYDAAKSSQSQKQSGTFSITYGDGSTSSGTPYTDTVTVAGITVTNQAFAAVTTESSEFQSQPLDGLMGMGLPALSSLKQDPFFTTAVKQGVVPEGSFGFKLAANGSELYLGGTDTSLYKGDIESHDVVSDVGYWVIGDAKALVGSKTAVSDLMTIIDSGTTLIIAPPSSAKKFFGAIKGAQDSGDGYYTFPCDSVPKVQFNWGGKSWAISADNFNLGQEEEGSSSCVACILPEDLGFGGDSVWLVGDAFMKNVYTVFSTDENSVGFAELA